MADDTNYTNFLDNANLDPNASSSIPSTSATTKPRTATASTSQNRTRYDPSTSAAGLPPSLADLSSLSDTPYTSDTDADWEPVFLNYASDELPDAVGFGRVVAHQESGHGGGDVEELTVHDFDPRGRYAEVVKLVERAGREDRAKTVRGGGDGGGSDDGDKSKVKIFRVQRGVTRVEYYVVTVGERKLLGLMAAAVES